MSAPTRTESSESQPAWEIATLFPPQGQWNAAAYLSLTDSINQLVELTDGRIEVLPMPTRSHQKIVFYLVAQLGSLLNSKGLGDVVGAPYRIRLSERSFRGPDVVAYLTEHLSRFGERYGEAADLVIEVVSSDPASRQRDYHDKRREYALAKIAEYWIVDPIESCITVLGLEGDNYLELGRYTAGQVARSRLFPSWELDVDSTFAV